MEVIKATLTDVANIVRLIEAETSRYVSKRYISSLISNNKYPTGVAYDGNTLVGFYICGEFTPDMLELESIYVTKQYRSNGIGSKLLRHMEESISDDWNGVMFDDVSIHGGANKRQISNFYLNQGFKIIAIAGQSRTFYKSVGFKLIPTRMPSLTTV